MTVKFLTSLMALWCLCLSVQASREICFQMSQGLANLNSLYKQNKTNVSFPTTMNVPSGYMQKHANNCVGVFVRELKSILSNVTVYNDDRDSLLGIQSALLQLEAQHPAARGQQDGQTCLMKPAADSLTPFQQYINFLLRLRKTKRH